MTPSSAHVKPGGSLDFTFTMTNKSTAPLRLVLLPGQQPVIGVLQVLEGGDRVIEPLEGGPPVTVDARCAHVDCPLRAAPAPGPAQAEITLAPQGIALVRGTWTARRRAWPKAAPSLPCCSVDLRQPVDAGPLAPGSYRVTFLPPVSDENGQVTLEHDEIQVDVAP